MEIIHLSFSVFIQLCIVGDIHAGFGVAPYLHLHKQKSSHRPFQKRERILNFGRFEHAGQCISEKCDWLGLHFPGRFTDRGQLKDTFLTRSLSESCNQIFDFKERRVKLAIHDADWPEKKIAHRDEGTTTVLVDKLAKGLNRPDLIYENNKFSSKELLVQAKRKRVRHLILRSRYLQCIEKLSKDTDRKNGSVERVFRREVNDENGLGNSYTTEGPKTANVDLGDNGIQGQSASERPECQIKLTIAPEGNGKESRLPYDLDGDAYKALGSLTFLLVVLTSAVMYTGLWKKRNTMLYPNFNDPDRTSTRRKTDIKALLKAKLGKVPVSSMRVKGRLGNHRMQRGPQYSVLPLLENGDLHSSEDVEEQLVNSEEEELW